ncbi:hypothetical protein L0U85_18700 [Glycomyces sp. L485]|uniref:hypothetical protein n=1 Tax=Glycomyces sp. L485 TaxID=2909235 RepID=UPI001F4B50B3|nr:hypothetical protein [Glycomyces sp. L485]MCH7232867.1 hypothetical protein [Glycomyces sp. L485]
MNSIEFTLVPAPVADIPALSEEGQAAAGPGFRVEATHEHIAWQNLRNGHRKPWGLSTLGPFVFEGTECETALRQATLAGGAR